MSQLCVRFQITFRLCDGLKAYRYLLMPSATARADAGIDSVALRLWASLSSCSSSRGIPHGHDPRALYAEALLSDERCPRSQQATTDGGSLNNSTNKFTFSNRNYQTINSFILYHFIQKWFKCLIVINCIISN